MTSPEAAEETARSEVERVTAAAARAAEQGQWDRVEECYRMREATMSRVALQQDQIERLLAVDRRVTAQALVAKTALTELLRQSFATRMKLKGLRSGVGESGGDPGTLQITA